MSHLKLLKSLNITALLWLIPCFFIWQIFINPLLSQVLLVPANAVVNSIYPEEGFRLEYQNNNLRVLHSNILAKQQPIDSEQLNLISQLLQPNTNMMLGLPLFWALVLSLSLTYRQYLIQITLGSIVLLLSIASLYCYDAVLDAAYLLNEVKEQLYFSNTGDLLPLSEVNPLLISIADSIRNLLFYFVVLFMPILLIFSFSKK